MLLAIDIGNTNTVVGLFENEKLLGHFRVSSNRNSTADEVSFLLKGHLLQTGVNAKSVSKAIIGSVVPPLTNVFAHSVEQSFGCRPIIVTSKLNLPVKINVDEPEQVGADRIANAVAGVSLHGAPVIVVDFGTATTFDVVDGHSQYIGGIIIPGPETAMSELAKRAARLFEVQIEQPERVVGRSTTEALKSGLFYGTIGQVDYLVDKILEETKLTGPAIVATGGFSSGLDQLSRHITKTDMTLTLVGLRLIAESNS